MGIKKADLRSFVEAKARDQKRPLKAAIFTAIKDDIRSTVVAMNPGADVFEAKAEQFVGDLLDFYHSLRNPGYELINIKNRIENDVIGRVNREVERYTRLIESNLLRNATNGLPEKIDAHERTLKTRLSGQVEKCRAIDNLERELYTVIDSCRTGDAAYKRMQELGVDLTGFIVVSNNLPAVLKLSADVCLFNGNCS